LGFYTLPTLFSAYAYGRRHAVMTALSSVLLVVLLAQFNPTLFSYRIALPDFIERWFDLGVWAGILLVTAYAMGTLYERNRRNLEELRESYHGILMILQQFAANDKYSQDHAYRVAVCATRIAECMSLDADRIEDVRAAALLHNVDQLGISMDVLCRAAQMTQGEAEDKKREKAMGGSLRRVIPIVLAHQRLGKGQESDKLSAPLEARILEVADAYETLTGGQSGEKLSPDQAEEAIIRGSGSEYDSRVVDAFIKAFQRRVMKKGTGV
jgi:HD-GYP domain-containing protein (c-di-GMP phosphodiesterase class II)